MPKACQREPLRRGSDIEHVIEKREHFHMHLCDGTVSDNAVSPRHTHASIAHAPEKSPQAVALRELLIAQNAKTFLREHCLLDIQWELQLENHINIYIYI